MFEYLRSLFCGKQHWGQDSDSDHPAALAMNTVAAASTPVDTVNVSRPRSSALLRQSAPGESQDAASAPDDTYVKVARPTGPARVDQDVSASQSDIEENRSPLTVLQSSVISDQSLVPSKISESVKTLKNSVKLLAKKAEPFLDGTPFKIPVSVLNSFIDLASTVSDNNSAMRALLQQLAKTLVIVTGAMDSATSDGAKERACKLSEFLSHEMQDFEALQKRHGIQKILNSDEDVKYIEAAIVRIDRELDNFRLDVINSIERMVASSREQSAFQTLYRAAANDASHDAGERFPPPRCHPDTRTDILPKLQSWALENNPSNQILWLHAPAGAGKSAIAQTLCQDLVTEGRLGGSFFFKRGDASRGESKKLFPTLAYHLACLLPAFKTAITAQIEADPGLFDKSLSIQLEKLVIVPARTINLAFTLVLVIDGLDECMGEKRQEEIIRAIARVPGPQLPLRFLIASRPETHIADIFQEFKLGSLYDKFIIDPSFVDIETFLRAEFARILQVHNTMVNVPEPWPTAPILQHLIDKSSGYFIYAATIIRFVDDPDFRPTDRLKLVMGMAEPENESPFAALDQLYTEILEAVPAHRSQLLRILSVFATEGVTGYGLTMLDIEQLLELKAGDVLLMLRRLHSVINVPSQSATDKRLRTYHASFLDYLNDQTRSHTFYTGAGSVYHLKLVMNILKAFSYSGDDPSLNAISHVTEHIRLTSKLITAVPPTADLVRLFASINPDFVFRFDYYRPGVATTAMLDWLKTEGIQTLPHKDLINLWEDYKYMAICSEIWSKATMRKTAVRTHEFLEVEQIRAWTSPQLVQLLHSYVLLYRDPGPVPTLTKIRQVLGLSWNELRTIVCALRQTFGEVYPEKLDLLLRSASCLTHIHNLHPEPTLQRLARGTMQTMIKVTTHELPGHLGWAAPLWGCVLRSCPPDPGLLQTLHEMDRLSAFSIPNSWYNKANVLNAIEWLKRFPEPPSDFIARIQELVPNSKSGFDDIEDHQTINEFYDEWRETTGW